MRLTYRTSAIVLMVAVSIVLQASPRVYLLPASQEVTGRVRGTVMDFNEAVIPDVTILFESGQTKRKVVSEEAGNFEIELPPGIYRVSTEVNNFFPFRRAAFRVQPGTITTINIVPVPRAVSYGTEAPRFYYESFSPLYTSGEPLDLLIRFNKRRKHKGIIQYSLATASYNALTIHADKMCLNSKTFQLKAEGNVIIEDGKQRMRVKRAEVEFKAGEPIIKLT